MRVLIVDDSTFIRRYMRQLLEGAGSACEEASCGEEALERLGTGAEFNVMLLDLNMPGMDGIACLRGITKEQRRGGMKVLMVTTESSHDLIEEALEAGADEFLMKPFTPACLRDKLLLLLGRDGLMEQIGPV